MHSCDDGLGNGVDRLHQHGAGREQLVVERRIAPDHLAQVVAGGEGRPGAGEDDRADVSIGAEVAELHREVLHQIEAERVAPVWPVERDGRRCAMATDEKGKAGSGHGLERSDRRARTPTRFRRLRRCPPCVRRPPPNPEDQFVHDEAAPPREVPVHLEATLLRQRCECRSHVIGLDVFGMVGVVERCPPREVLGCEHVRKPSARRSRCLGNHGEHEHGLVSSDSEGIREQIESARSNHHRRTTSDCQPRSG